MEPYRTITVYNYTLNQKRQGSLRKCNSGGLSEAGMLRGGYGNKKNPGKEPPGFFYSVTLENKLLELVYE